MYANKIKINLVKIAILCSFSFHLNPCEFFSVFLLNNFHLLLLLRSRVSDLFLSTFLKYIYKEFLFNIKWKRKFHSSPFHLQYIFCWIFSFMMFICLSFIFFSLRFYSSFCAETDSYLIEKPRVHCFMPLIFVSTFFFLLFLKSIFLKKSFFNFKNLSRFTC